MSLSSGVAALADQWLQWDTNPDDRKQIEDLVETGDEEELRQRLQHRIQFGTAGLRGRMCAGFAHMNDLTVTQASQGLCRYLEATFPDIKSCGVVVGRDHRYHSVDFCRITAGTFLKAGIKVYLFPDIVPTPYVAYAVTRLNAAAGVMITASHNPKEDNGYKVYWDNGSQIIPPHDKGIASSILSNLPPWGDVQVLVDSAEPSMLVNPTATISAMYNKDIATQLCCYPDLNPASPRVVFTAMHGVGKRFVADAFAAFSLPPYIPVPGQIEADPDFPTVAFPNPEEGKGALRLAMLTAEDTGASLVLANDPDSDRLAMAERQSDGEWVIFNGNQLGILFAWWVWHTHRVRYPGVIADKCLVMNTAVSSRMLEAMATKEGLRYGETLTGFKWLGNSGEQLCKEKGLSYLYAYEEAIGYMIGDVCLDKDGVRAAAVAAEMNGWLAREGRSCHDQLERLYDTYGHFVSKNRYFFCYEKDKMDAVFSSLWGEGTKRGDYPTTCGPFKVAHVRDLTHLFDTRTPDNVATLPRSSYMITFYFENGCTATIRGSGTEPKLKYYVETRGPNAETAESELNEMVEAIISHFLRPDHFGLIPPSED